MQESRMDMNFFYDILPNLPRDYTRAAVLAGNPNALDSCLTYLLELNDAYQSVESGPNYKVLKCAINNCNIPECKFFHSSQDRRRDLTKFAYEPKSCFAVYRDGIWNEPERCKKGDACGFSHNPVEMKHHPKFYQPTQVPNENKSHEEHKEPSLQHVTSQINNIKSEIREMQKNIEEKTQQISMCEEEIGKLRELALCFVCRADLYAFATPCGHLCCVSCRTRIVSVCLCCSKPIRSGEIVELRKNPYQNS